VTVTSVRYLGELGSGDALGQNVASSGRYVMANPYYSRAHKFYLWRRDDAGVLQLLLDGYVPTTPSVDGYCRSIDCWYNEAESRLEIVCGTSGDSNPTRKCGSVLMMDWPDSGTVAGDMTEWGLFSANLVDQYDPQGIGFSVAMCRGRCIAMGNAGNGDVLFLSRTGDVWAVDKLDDTSYNAWNAYGGTPPCCMTEHPDDENTVLGVIAAESDGAYGRIHVVKSTGPGNWSDPATLLGNTGGGGWYTGRGAAIGPGANGNITVASDWGQNPEGFAIWDRDPDDPTDATWLYRGRVKCNNRERPYGMTVGYNFIAGGDNYGYLGTSRVGPYNATVFDGPAPGAWNVDEFAEFYGAGVDYHALEDSILDPGGMDISYQEGGIVRLITGCYNYQPGPPPGSGGATGGIIEYNGDGDWPSPPNPTPVDQTYTISTVTVVARDVIKVNFNAAVAITESLITASSYQISGGSYEVAVDRVLPIVDGQNAETTAVYLALRPKALPGDAYEITIPSAGAVLELQLEDPVPEETLYSPDGGLIAAMTAEWFQHRTKVDSVLSSFPGSYSMDLDSSLRMILQAITISDEVIGGDF
jgi:hypothetical protein